MAGRHELPIAVKRNFTETRILAAYRFITAVQLQTQINEGCFCRIADFLSLSDGRVVAEHTVSEKLHLRRLADINISGGNPGSVYIIIFYGHLVLCKRTGFIRADYLCATESFNCGEFADDGIFL